MPTVGGAIARGQETCARVRDAAPPKSNSASATESTAKRSPHGCARVLAAGTSSSFVHEPVEERTADFRFVRTSASRAMDSSSRARMRSRAAIWRVAVEDVLETATAIVAYGSRGEERVVVKIDRQQRDESRSAAVLRGFRGNGTVRILDHAEDALLLERITPGESLTTKAATGHDDDATGILADVIGRMSADGYSGVPTVEEWGNSFERYRAGDDHSLPHSLVEEACNVYGGLCASQHRRRLLHGDLHHGNVLFDSQRGWLAIDPKGVLGELEYEIGAALRNPIECPEVFLDRRRIRARIDDFADRLQLDRDRIVGWAFAQAILSAVWLIEDGFAVERDHPWLELARRIRQA